MTIIFVRHLPIILLALGVVALVLTARPFLIGKAVAQRHANFKSLRLSSPVLNALIAGSVIGKPVLEYLQKHDWSINLLPSSLVAPVTVAAIASVYALLAGIVTFFFRAIRNINVLNNAKIRSPYAAFLMLIPISNIIVVPYLEYYALHRSRIAAHGTSSRWTAGVLVISSYALLLVGLVFDRLPDMGPPSGPYGSLSLLVMSLSIGGAGGILTSRVIRGIADAQDLGARQCGLLVPREPGPGAERRKRISTHLQSAAVAALLTVAVVIANFPDLPSEIVRAASHALSR